MHSAIQARWQPTDGLKRNGHPEAAEELRASTIAAIETEGFAEYFDLCRRGLRRPGFLMDGRRL